MSGSPGESSTFTDGRHAEWEPGLVVGIRRFRVDALGRLCPLHWNTTPWRPGANTATCNAFGHPRVRSKIAPNTLCESPAPIAHPNCTCGWYGFHTSSAWNGKNDGMPVVEGIITGWGHATIGDEGFRCEHAKIVALHLPRPGRLERAATRVGFTTTTQLTTAGLLAAAVAIFTVAGITGAWPFVWLAALSVALAWFTLDDAPWDRPLISGHNWVGKVTAAYPDVAAYRTRRAMLAAHPLTGPPAKPVLTPDDPDFWDAEVPS